jgi:3-hydroxyacyl-CoA dehydrogenase/enoyl-CoA hydratase/3-hydroxybutyryl-CoA epimerase
VNVRNFKLDIDGDGIATVVYDVPGRSMNTLTAEVIEELPRLVEQLRGNDRIKGVLLRSGKTSGFCAGADLGDLSKLAGARIAVPPLSGALRALETIGKPVASLIEGLALGGGLEFLLATHYRVAVDSPKIKVGLPEVLLGLLPAAGGTQRLPRLVGVKRALPLLLEGRSITVREAAEIGMIDELVPADSALESARRWLLGPGSAEARWDKKGFRIPDGLPYSPEGAQIFTIANAMLRKKTYGNLPAPENILRCVFEGIQVPFDTGLRIELRYFLNTFATAQARAMVRTLFISKQALAKGSQASAKVDPPRRVAVIGAGMMGAGIAYVQAARGIETPLIDVTVGRAEKGKDYARGLVAKAIDKGQMTRAAGDGLLARIAPAGNYQALEGVDLVVEAVFEDLDLKHDVIRRVDGLIPDQVFVGSNTSTLPITTLAEASSRPDKFIGIHFFSPVDRMELIEIIRGRQTSQATVDRAIAYATALGKTPVIVNDSRGFYTSRCFGTYLDEGLEMLLEGVPPALIENAGRMTGMPRGPLELRDDVGIDLTVRVAQQTRAALGNAYISRPYEALLESMVKAGRAGRKSGAGFYDYPTDGAKSFWSGLAAVSKVPPEETDVSSVDRLKLRLLHRQALEAARCYGEAVISDPGAADAAAILAWGFAPWTGGPLSYIDNIGTMRFAAECDELAATHGARFTPPESLRKMAVAGTSFYSPSGAAAK